MPGPVQNAEAQKLLAMLAGGGGAPGGGSPGAPPPSPAAAQLGQATQQLDGANPEGMVSTLRSMNDALAQVYLMAAMRIPDMAEDISKARASLDKAILKAQKASQALGAVRPIANSAGVGPQAGATPPAGSPDLMSMFQGAA